MPEVQMAGRKFLTPMTKISLCVLGMAIMGYFLYTSISEGALHDSLTLVRFLVFLGFGYLLVRSAMDLFRQGDG